MWQITEEFGKLKNKKIIVYYVAPQPYKYGFASFLDEKSAIIYRDKMNTDK